MLVEDDWFRRPYKETYWCACRMTGLGNDTKKDSGGRLGFWA